MTNTKTTKRALIASALSVLMCISMLIGSTFAWFTDSASTGVNKIVSGKLDVALEMYKDGEWVSAEGETLNFIAADGNEDILWEPGCTYELPKLRVVNNGNLALKFKVALTGIEGDAKLNEAIEWKTSWAVGSGAAMIGYEETMVVALMEKGDNMEFTLSGHMYEEAGNEYQDLTIDGVSITVYATQMTYESDSTDNQYDAGATLPTFYSVEGNLVTANEGQHLVGNGSTAILNAYQIYSNTIDNYVIASNIASQAKGDNTFNNCTFTELFWLDDVANGTTVTFNNCSFEECIKLGGNETVKYVFNNCSFEGPVNWSKALITVYAPIELNNCTFDYSAGALYSVRLADGVGIENVTVKGNSAIVQDYTYGKYIVSESGYTAVNNVAAAPAGETSSYDEGSVVVGGTATIPVSEGYNRLNADGVTFVGVTFNDSKIVTNGDVTFIDCTFNGNLDNSVPSDLVTFTGCTFNGNVHFASGSGADVADSDFVATDCVFNKMLTLSCFENTTLTGCEFYGNNWAGKNVITYAKGLNTFTDCTFTTGIRAASGLTAADFVITNCNITIADVSNLS